MGEVGWESSWKRISDADPIILVETEGEGDAAVPRSTDPDSTNLLLL